MWAWNMIRGKPGVQSAAVSGIGGGAGSIGSGSYSNYGGDAAMADMGNAEQRRARRRRRRRARQTLACVSGRCGAQRRARRTRHRHGPLKVRRVGVQASTGKRIFQGRSGGRFTRGSRGHKNYL